MTLHPAQHLGVEGRVGGGEGRRGEGEGGGREGGEGRGELATMDITHTYCIDK